MIVHNIEYTRELLNSNCDLDFIKSLVIRVTGKDKLIENKIFDIIKQNQSPYSKEKITKIVYDLTTEKYTRNYCMQATLFDRCDYELSWRFAMELIVNNLNKIFVDSNIYYENKEVYDINNNISVHRLIIVEWAL